jgi:hypothetical protein
MSVWSLAGRKDSDVIVVSEPRRSVARSIYTVAAFFSCYAQPLQDMNGLVCLVKWKISHHTSPQYGVISLHPSVSAAGVLFARCV